MFCSEEDDEITICSRESNKKSKPSIVKCKADFVSSVKRCQNKKGQTFVELHRFLIYFCSRQVIEIQKKDSKDGAAQQTFDPSYFFRALG